MINKSTIVFIISILIFSATSLWSQTFPVTVSTNITPPYSTYLGDYVAPGSQKLALNIFVNDLNRPELQTRLRLRIEGQGILIETKQDFLPSPLLLQGGVPERLVASDLAQYFLPQNLNFSGITRQQFERTGQLPEGLYRFCFEVLEYNRGSKVSNSGCTMAWLILNDPPLINLPNQNEKLRPQEPQYITFQWTPRHTGSPNSAFSTEYEFTLVELWPETRNPNDAILTSPPIYQTTTQSTTLIYGPAETPLELGRRYAFQVRAKSITGANELDLFKNQGRSQVHSFQYGDACQIPTNIKATASNSGAFKINFDPKFNHTAFSIRYKKANDPQARWYEEDSYFEEIEINGLQAETTYDYQITAGCGPFNSEYTPVAQITTDAMPEVTYACGLPPEDYDFGNNEPLPSLQKDDILYAGDFDVKISEATGSAGTFTGKGTVVVPYLDNLAVSVEFASISVNTDYRMTAGSMDVKGIGVDVLPDDFTDFLDELDESLASVDDVLDDVSDGLDVADEILDEVGDLANDILDNGPFTDEEEAEMEDFTVEQYEEAAQQALGAAASALNGGATTQNISEAATQLAKATALKNRGSKLKNIHNNSDTLNIQAVEFHENLSQFNGNKMGFDQQAHKAHRLHYNIMVLPDGNVAVPWVATKAGEAGSVKAKFLPNESIDIENILFKSGADGATLDAQLNGNEWTVSLPAVSKDQPLVINALDDEGGTVGKLNAIGYEEIKRKVHIVPVGTSTADFSDDQLTTYLNQVYAQAGASWEVEMESAITVEGYDGTLQDDEQQMLSTYSEGMKAIIKAYKNKDNISIVDNEFYLFLVDKSQTGKSGYMPRKHQYGFIYMGESGNKQRTIAHELGHGAFRLQHPWEEYPTIAEGSTDNLMDYGEGTNLRKYQWDLIHNPPVVVGLVEDLEEGAQQGTLVEHIKEKLNSLSESLDSKIFSIVNCETCEEGEYIEDGIKFTNLPQTFIDGLTYDSKVWSNVDDASIVAIEQLRKGKGICYAFYFSSTQAQELDFQLEEAVVDPSDAQILAELTLFDQSRNTSYNCSVQRGEWSSAICGYDNAADISQSYLDNLVEKIKSCQEGFSPVYDKYRQLSPKQFTIIYEDNQLITIDPDKGMSLEDATDADYAQKLEDLKNGLASDYDAVLYRKLSTGYELKINFGKNIVPKAGYDQEGKAKDQTEKVLEDILNAKLKDISSLLDKNAQITPGVFNDGKKIIIQETDWWESVSNIVSATNEFIADVEIKEKYWNSVNSGYSENWINTPPFLTGGGNAIIEEIKEIPQLAAMVANIAVDKPTRDQLWTSLKELDGEKIANGLYGMGESYVNTFTEGGDPAWHQGGKTVVQVASMFITGGIKKGAGAVKDNIDKVSDKVKSKADDVANDVLDILAELEKKFDTEISFNKFKDDFGSNLGDLRKFKDNPELVESWKKLDDLGFSQAARKNIDNLNQRSIIDEYADNIASATNSRKGNFGEIGADLDLNGKGYESLQPRITDIDASGHNGIDGVYRAPDGSYVIIEGKYTGSASLNPAKGDLPRQMSDDWIERPGELANAVGNEQLAQTILNSDYKRVLAKVSPDGSVKYQYVSETGYLSKGEGPLGEWNP